MFYVAPRINATGRIKQASLALELLISDNKNSAETLALENRRVKYFKKRN